MEAGREISVEMTSLMLKDRREEVLGQASWEREELNMTPLTTVCVCVSLSVLVSLL